ncbi:MAG TPA: CYTH domain-containing protein [Ilumatobacteraceae bacterium]|nr:CYTH domain-containing protein [Ilumatobacteraceae bacterium]
MIIERERKFLVDTPPPLGSAGIEIRQGYVAIDGAVEVRVRDLAGNTAVMSVKIGTGSTRTEIEVPISREQFDELWSVTGGRQIAKTRYLIDDGDATIEVDIFHGRHEGLMLAEVEFATDEAMTAYRPPSWLGREVTDDPDYSNAVLSRNEADRA